MTAGSHDPDPAPRERLVEGRRRARDAASAPAPDPRTAALAALQRSAGNAAVSALIAGRWRSRGGEAVAKIDTALREIRRDEPDVAKVEPGLRAAKAAGVPVDLDGYAQKPPASALDVVRTGFGPGAVPGRKPAPPPKPTPRKSPLAKASGPAPKPAGPPGKGAAGPPVTAAPAPVAAAAPDLLAPPVPPTRVGPTDDPGFVHVTKAVRGQARAKKAHAPAAVKAKEAQDAALAPSGDVDAQAKAAKVDTMDAQRPGGFDKKAFIAAVKSAIEAKTPKNLNEAADYKKSGKAGEVKNEVKNLVAGDKQASTQDVETATAAPPDPDTAVPKQVTPMPAEQPGQPQAVPAATAVPKPAPPEQLNLAAGKHEADREMAEGEVTEQQLKESNEPEFEGAVAAKQEAARHADTAPAAFRAEEKATLAQARTDANEQTAATTAGMHGGRLAALAKVVAGKAATKSKDEARRAEVTTKVQNIFAATETAVKKILTGIDPNVDREFEAGEKGARAAFEQYVHAKMTAYKKDRYGGWLGGFRWLRDKLAGMPPKVNEFFAAGRELYLKEMDKVISRVAEIVAKDLTAAKNRIAAGKTEIATYVKGLPRDLQKVGANASKEIGDQFQQLESEVNDKQDALVDTLASKYVEARKGLDDRIEELQAENKGLVDKAIGAIKAVINTIRQLAAMLRDVFVKAAGVVGEIISSPGRFLGNLVDGVKGGITRFKDNILTHLREGLMAWLFGSVAKGVELPDSFDARGVVQLLTSIFGLTKANIRARLVRAVGERAVGVLETAGDVFPLLLKEGPAGIWHLIVAKVGDVKDLIVEKAKSFIVNRIIHAGIEFLISLLNPVAAFIKACKLIYQIVMFFVENIERIARFVNTVLDSVGDVARGAVGAVSEKVESALAQMVPILIGFFARVLNIGGIGEKIREIVKALQKPVTKAVDAIIATGLKVAAPLIRGVKGISAKAKAKVEAGKAYVKGKVSDVKGKAYVKGKVEAGKKWVKGKAAAVKAMALSLIQTTFGMRGESHILTRTPEGDIEMASAKRRKLSGAISTALSDVQARKRAMTEAKARATEIEAKGKKAKKSEKTLLDEINTYLDKADKFLADVGQIDAVRKQIEKSRAQNPKKLLAQLSSMLESLGWRYKLGDLGPLAGPDPKIVGTIADYDDLKKGRVNELGTGEAEHIIPGATMEAFIRGWSKNKVFYVRGTGTNSVYKKDITILIPKRMADIKTDLGAASEESDQAMIRRVKAAMDEARALNGKVRGKPNKAQQAKFDDLAKRTGSINELVMSRLALTIAARKQYVQELRKGVNVGLPAGMTPAQAIKIVEERISDSQIHQAALEQLANIWSLDPLG